MATPSTLGSLEKSRSLQVQIGNLAAQALGPGPQVRLLEGVVQAHHGTPVPDGLEQPEGAAPTVWVGESAVTSDGSAASSSRSSRTRRSYSASGISGASSTLYRSL